MVAKKRSTLRGKASARLGHKTVEESVPEVPLELPEDPKAFLHQRKETKKDKLLTKQTAFLSQIKNSSANEFGGISKSAVRRRKRKERDDLKPKMQDLLTSLEQEGDLKEFTENAEGDSTAMEVKRQTFRLVERDLEPGTVKIKKNEPNIRNKRGAKILSIKETERFSQVLQNEQFKKNSFSALRDIIKMQKR
ncbi:Slx9p KNAG_0B01210 [Huiozyma naganishii CBS 8797]|uniref:Ribosome biogenesis protein SLX9 n=1 Tax=Huiozyma naganishii (strain ATCC MYA-139 / BCRC 22969 / CBS 8797 / KCTC 17520 / NBRC 10181 / NCYC 3082 / Yp74L-3) TaxID=1071383 RepID=J7RGA6_HUIN7|nr:hypothetical protein KNAG_0B01210 [Kazachstania naganishii CBS 8797]CCK68568.1 hypothetical protein KNAG_0B01210 [Kazachstania naganishii CBS 8797]